MIGLRDTRNKPAIVFNAVHALAEPTLILYNVAQVDPTIRQALNGLATATLNAFTVTQFSATAFQSLDALSIVTTEDYVEDLFDVTIITEVLELPNLVPMADVSNGGGWTTAPLWSKVNTPGSSATWITSTNANGSTCRLRFTSPVMATPAVLRLYRRKSGGTNNPDFIWALFRDGVQIQTNTLTLTSTVFTQTDYPLDADLVADAVYEIELTRSGGGGPSARGVVDMAALWIDPV